MCGILAVLQFDNKPIDRASVIRMRDTMVHRGPDGEGVYLDESVALAHRRLAIIDLSEGGRQPMKNEDGSIVLVFNGEIYNYVELREDLKKKGHRFFSTSDTEVIIRQYEEDGERCLAKFNGMFGFVLWDRRRRKLFAARDRLGIKPIYYFADHDRIIFASEIKAILEDRSVPREPDVQALYDYLFAGRVLGDKTMFKNIRELEPGHSIDIDQVKKTVEVKKYWEVHYNYRYNRTDADVKEELNGLLHDAVKVHCRSDAPFGAHLSGGLDSSTMVALASHYKKPLKTFSIKFSEDKHVDETRYAKIVAKHVGADYFESAPSGIELARLFPFLVWHMDTPMANVGGFSYFKVSQLAQKHVKVALTGHGGDELFAGYPAQFQASYGRTDMFSLPSAGKEGSSWKRRLVGGIYRSIKNTFSKGERSPFEASWVRLHCNTGRPDSFFENDLVRRLGEYSPEEAYLRPLREAATDQALDKCLYHDLRVYLPSLLHLEDRASMALSIESRVPFLDYRIVEFLATVPPEQKVKGLQPKYLMRQAASAILPEEVWGRKEKFPFPVSNKDAQGLKDFCRQVLLSSESLKRGLFKPAFLEGAGDFNAVTMQLLNIELWFKIFIDQDPFWLGQTKLS
jgi:asparagine synthase (glutamine-hydrolysing)